ncbi:MAG: hypothetical protein F6J90_29895 [Moorea sp. SIOASIH]|nr:hypothetical protein [Moorena sp. SIOASIH]
MRTYIQPVSMDIEDLIRHNRKPSDHKFGDKSKSTSILNQGNYSEQKVELVENDVNHKPHHV